MVRADIIFYFIFLTEKGLVSLNSFIKYLDFVRHGEESVGLELGGGAGAGACMKNDDVVDSLDANQSINQSIVIW